MKIRPFRIPKSVVFPGLVVHVRVLSRDSVELEGDDGTWRYDAPNGPGPSATVYIASSLTLPERRYTLIHELGHVWWDYLHMALKFHGDIIKVC